MKRKMRFLLAAMLAVTLVTGCGGGYKSAEAPADAYYKTDDAEYIAETRAQSEMKGVTDNAVASKEEQSGTTEYPQGTNVKIIYSTYMDVETEKYDEYMAAIYQKLAEVGGHEDSSYVYNRNSGYRSAELVLRVPSEKRQEFIDSVSDLANVTSINNTSRNITLNYIDNESRIQALRTEQARLLELLEQAQEINELLIIEQRLTDVRYELQSYESIQKGYDYDVDYSTVTMSIREVQREVPMGGDSLGDRIKRGFSEQLYRVSEGFQDFLVWMASNFIVVIIWLAVIAVIVRVIVWLFRRTKNRPVREKKSRRKKKGQEELAEISRVDLDQEKPEGP